jgi:hypothetical protein
MMFRSLLVHILRHNGVLAILRQSSATPAVLWHHAANWGGAEGRFVAVFWAAYIASHRLAMNGLRGVLNPKRNSRSRINRNVGFSDFDIPLGRVRSRKHNNLSRG